MPYVFSDKIVDHRGKTRIACYCPRCLEKRYLPRYLAVRDTNCYRCSCAEKARLYRLNNPSKPEQKVIRILNKLKIEYEREVACGPYNIDFVIGQLALEINGGVIHAYFREPEKAEKRSSYIQNFYRLIHISDSEISERNIRNALQM